MKYGAVPENHSAETAHQNVETIILLIQIQSLRSLNYANTLTVTNPNAQTKTLCIADGDAVMMLSICNHVLNISGVMIKCRT